MSKENILQAAALLFQQKGYHATSMQDIADAVELKKGSLYHYVDSKQDILFALLNEALELILERLEYVAGQDLSPEQKIRQATRAYLNFLAENPSLSSVLLLEYRSLEEDYKKLHIPRRDQDKGGISITLANVEINTTGNPTGHEFIAPSVSIHHNKEKIMRRNNHVLKEIFTKPEGLFIMSFHAA